MSDHQTPPESEARRWALARAAAFDLEAARSKLRAAGAGQTLVAMIESASRMLRHWKPEEQRHAEDGA